MKNWEVITREQRIINAMKSIIGCIICGEKRPEHLLFHHQDPSTKKFDISLGISKMIDITILEKEILKCEIRCLKCHRNIHPNSGKGKGPKNYTLTHLK